MSDLSHIPDGAVTAAQEAGNHAYRDGADDATCWRLGLAAALPVLNTAKDSETAGEFTADEYRRVWNARFDTLLSNADVLDEDDQLSVLAVHEALLAEQYFSQRAMREELAGLRAEVAELRRRDAEYAASLRGEQP